jgi:hypothetical protein
MLVRVIRVFFISLSDDSIYKCGCDQAMGCLRASMITVTVMYPTTRLIMKIILIIGRHRDRARSRRLCHGVQRRAARRRRDRIDSHRSTVPRHPRCGGNIGASLPIPTTQAYFYPCSSMQEESSLDAQKRIAREFYDTVEDIPLDE